MNKMEYKIHDKDLDIINLKGLYLIRNLDNNQIKIGIAKKLQRRFKEICSSFRFCGIKPNLQIEYFVECEYNLELEQHLHKVFEKYNSQNEWFDIDNIEIIIDEIKKFKPKTINKKENKNNIKINKKSIDKNSVKTIINNYYSFTDKEITYYIKALSYEDAISKLCYAYSNVFYVDYSAFILYEEDYEFTVRGNRVWQMNSNNEFSKLLNESKTGILVSENNDIVEYIDYLTNIKVESNKDSIKILYDLINNIENNLSNLTFVNDYACLAQEYLNIFIKNLKNYNYNVYIRKSEDALKVKYNELISNENQDEYFKQIINI